MSEKNKAVVRRLIDEVLNGGRLELIDEVYFFTVRDGRIAEAWGIEDTAKRLRQLGL